MGITQQMKLSTDEQLTIKKYFFNEGVALVEDKSQDLHPDMEIKNTEVMKMFTSLVSKGIATKQFCWRHAYFSITNPGIETLREELCLTEEDWPATHQDSTMQRMETVENVIAKEAL